jgi:hypothetical protein
MRCHITLDHIDGSKSKVRTVDLDSGISMSQLVFMMMKADVTGCSITKVDALDYLKNISTASEP